MMTSSNRSTKRQRRDQRPTDPRPMRETPRDQQIVRLVYEYRLLTQGQIERLLGRSRSTVQQVLMRLYHHHYLERIFSAVAPFGSSPTFYRLDRRGIALLQAQGVDDFNGVPGKRLSTFFLEHTMAINEVRLQLTLACERAGWYIRQWHTENTIKADYDKVQVKTAHGQTRRVPVVPDSYFVIELPGIGLSHFFLELDRGTMPIATFGNKIIGYVAYYKQGGFAQRYHTNGFRVLTVVDTPNEESRRVGNLVSQTVTVPGIGRRFWFTHLSRITPETILSQPIWQVAGDTEPAPLFQRV